jgi:hypothetical protein
MWTFAPKVSLYILQPIMNGMPYAVCQAHVPQQLSEGACAGMRLNMASAYASFTGSRLASFASMTSGITCFVYLLGVAARFRHHIRHAVLPGQSQHASSAVAVTSAADTAAVPAISTSPLKPAHSDLEGIDFAHRR